MIAITVWLLLAPTVYGRSTQDVKFADEASCKYVAQQIESGWNYRSGTVRCVRANILVPK